MRSECQDYLYGGQKECKISARDKSGDNPTPRTSVRMDGTVRQVIPQYQQCPGQAQ